MRVAKNSCSSNCLTLQCFAFLPFCLSAYANAMQRMVLEIGKTFLVYTYILYAYGSLVPT